MTSPPPAPPADASASELAREALALSEQATFGPWRVTLIDLVLNETGKARLKSSKAHTFPIVETAWDHPQLRRPVYIPGIADTPYYEPATHISWSNDADPVFIARSRELVPALAKAVLAMEADVALLRQIKAKVRGLKEAQRAFFEKHGKWEEFHPRLKQEQDLLAMLCELDEDDDASRDKAPSP